MAITPQTYPGNPATEQSIRALAEILAPSKSCLTGKVNVLQAAKAIRVGETNLKGRTRMILQAQGSGLTWGTDGQTFPFTLKPDEYVFLPFGEGVTVYARKGTGNADIAVVELA